MKYDSQLTELKNILPTAKNILIVLPSNADIDKLAAGLGLFLTFENSGKEVSVICEDTMKVSQSFLFGVDHIQKNIPTTDGGNLTLTLEGVASSDNTVPALEKLDWFAENNNLNLVFHVLNGQTFQPQRIIPHYQGSGFNLIFVVGAVNLNALGGVYSGNTQVFSGVHIVNVDNETANTNFGQTNILDSQSSSVSEIMVNLIQDLGFNLDADSASNLLAGIFDATNNLSDANVSAETYMAVANCLRVGGKKPEVMASTQSENIESSQPKVNGGFDLSALIPKSEPQIQPQMQSLNEILMPQSNAMQQSVSQPQSKEQPSQSAPIPSPEERPFGEGVISETPEPDWLTPKIFKGSSLG